MPGTVMMNGTDVIGISAACAVSALIARPNAAISSVYLGFFIFLRKAVIAVRRFPGQAGTPQMYSGDYSKIVQDRRVRSGATACATIFSIVTRK
jgi:hypothetical protein